jgi:hypothetical protein
VAAATKLSNLLAARLGKESLGRVHRSKPRVGRVTTMTGDAAKSPRGVNVAGERPRGIGETFITQDHVACAAVVHRVFLFLRRGV